MNEIIFVVEDSIEGGFTARALDAAIFTDADSFEELREMVKGAVHCHFENDESRPKMIRLHYVKDELFAA